MVLRYHSTTILALCVSGSCLLFYRESEQREADKALQVRESMINLQLAEQRLHRLKKDHANPLLNVLGEDIADLQIRLSETFSEWKDSDDRLITAYEQSLLTSSEISRDTYNFADREMQGISILRLDVQATLQNSSGFLALLDDLYRATGGWPSEIRACDVRRVPQDKLEARCVLDIYYWLADVDT